MGAERTEEWRWGFGQLVESNICRPYSGGKKVPEDSDELMSLGSDESGH